MNAELLIAGNVLVYASLAAGLVVLRRSPIRIRVSSFRALGELLRLRFPDLPPGFTLREGLARARQAQPRLNWVEIERELKAYEGYRYGGLPDAGSVGPALSTLIAVLKRRPR